MLPAYRLIRTERRTMSLEVNVEGEIVVRAPMRLPLREIEAFVASHEAWIARQKVKQVERAVWREQVDAIDPAPFRARARAYIPPRVAYYAELMGVSPTNITITSAKTRFGSCSPKNALSFSWRVMLYPPEAIDYVIVHELAHIRHHDHSANFYRFVERFMPDYRAREALLKRTLPTVELAEKAPL